MLAGGLPPILQSISNFPQSANVQTGEVFSTVVRAQDGALAAQIGGATIPIAHDAGFVAGQRISVQILSAGNPLQVAIQAASHAAPATSGGPAAATPLAQILRPILQTSGRLDLLPKAGSLLPPQLPAAPSSVQPLFALLLSERGLGQDLQQLQHVLSAATSANVIPADTVAAVVQWLGLAPGAAGRSWQQLLERARAERATVARIAQSLGKGTGQSALAAARDSAASLAQRLLNSEIFTTWLRERSELEPFKALAQRIQEHNLGSDLQNLRSIDQPYQFLELPVREQDGFYRADLHQFSEEKGHAGGRRTTIHRTVLDLETTKLGPLWVTVESNGPACNCHFRTAVPEVAELLEEHTAELQEALRTSGYDDAIVTVTPWSGDRVDAVFQLLAPYQKLDLEG